MRLPSADFLRGEKGQQLNIDLRVFDSARGHDGWIPIHKKDLIICHQFIMKDSAVTIFRGILIFKLLTLLGTLLILPEVSIR